MEARLLSISKTVFYKQVLEFDSKFLCQTSGRQNHWSLLLSRVYFGGGTVDMHLGMVLLHLFQVLFLLFCGL
jgi:hypothetical protein